MLLIQDGYCCLLYCRDFRNELTIRKVGALGCLIVREPSNLENRNLLLLTHQLNTQVIITISSESGWIKQLQSYRGNLSSSMAIEENGPWQSS